MVYAAQVLRDPLLVLVAERCFVPVFIRNSRANQHESAVLQSFGEATWNYPVLRFLKHDRSELATRLHDAWRASDPVAVVAQSMLAALQAGGYDVPSALIQALQRASSHTAMSPAEVDALSALLPA